MLGTPFPTELSAVIVITVDTPGVRDESVVVVTTPTDAVDEVEPCTYVILYPIILLHPTSDGAVHFIVRAEAENVVGSVDCITDVTIIGEYIEDDVNVVPEIGRAPSF